jgi:hypothetical protein
MGSKVNMVNREQ